MRLQISDLALRLQHGAVAAFPTETFFGLGADPRNPEAVTELLGMKTRGSGAGVPCIVSSRERAEEFLAGARFPECAAALADAFWPGPLSLVLSLPSRGAAQTPVQIDERLLGPGNTIAIRVSPSKTCAQLAEALGGILPATSANPHGMNPSRSLEEVERYFPTLPILDTEHVELADDGHLLRHERPSTLVDLSSDVPRILREGAISREILQEYFSEELL